MRSLGIFALQGGEVQQLTISPRPAGSSFPNLVTLSCPTGLRSGAQCRFTPKVIIPVATLPTW